MSKLEVDKIDPQSGTDLELGTSGDTITIPTGVTLDASNATTTLPSNVVTTDGTQTLTNKSIAASQLTGTITPSDSTVTLAKLTATGTKDATTFLRGDNTFAEPSGGGITEADAWYLDTTYTGDADITANLARVTDGGFAKLGTGMTESSGIFTFPSTGIWRIEFIAQFQDSGHDGRSIWGRILTTVNNSTYVTASSHGTFLYRYTSGVHYSVVTTSFIFDVTNTSTHKVKFNAGATNIEVRGSTSSAATQMQFIRLGDT